MNHKYTINNIKSLLFSVYSMSSMYEFIKVRTRSTIGSEKINLKHILTDIYRINRYIDE